MTSRRFILLLCAALLAVGGAFWLSAQRHLPHATATGDAVLPELRPEVNDVTRLRLSKGDGTHVTLVRRPNEWIVEERGFPADSGRVRKLLLDLAALAVVEEKTHDPKNYPLLGVEETTSPSAAGVLVEITAPRTVPALIVGKPAGAKAVYARRPGAEASFLVAPQLTLDSAPKGWLDRELLDVKPERVREVTVTVPGAPAWTSSRATRADGSFTVAALPKGRTLSSPSAADAAGTTLASLSIDDVRRLGTGPGTEAAAGAGAAAPYHAVVRTFDGLVVDLEGRAEGEHRYLRLVAHFDPDSRRPDPASEAAPATPAAGTPAPATPAAASSPRPALAPLAPVDRVEAEATAINARSAGFEFELAPYKFDAIFRPLETLLAKSAGPAKAGSGPAGTAPAGAAKGRLPSSLSD